MKYLPLILILTIIAGCGRSAHITDSLNKVEQLIDSGYYGRANHILDSIGAYTHSMADSQNARYLYLHAMSNTLAGIILSEDTTLKLAADYYRAVGDSDKMRFCEIHYGDALINSHLNDGFDGSLLLHNLSDSALAAGDTLTATMARMKLFNNFYKSRLADNAIIQLKIMDSLGLTMSDLHSNKFEYNQVLGYLYSISENPVHKDSSLIFYENAINGIATPQDSVALYDYVLRNYSSALIDANMPMKALEISRKVYENWKTSHPQKLYIIYLDMAMAYLQAGQVDSTAKYLELFERNSTSYVKNREYLGYHYQLIRQLLKYKQTGHFNIHEIINLNNNHIATTKFGWERMEQAQRAKLLGERRQAQLKRDKEILDNWIKAGIVLSVIIAFMILTYVRRHRRMVAEMEEQVESLAMEIQRIENGTSDDNLVKKMMLRQLGILKLVASNPTTANQELLHSIMCVANREIDADSLLDWPDIFRTMDYLYDGFHSDLERLFGNSLNEQEIRLCCLLKAGFSTKEIMLVTQQSLQTVYQRKSSIRKKTGMPEKADIAAHIDRIRESRH